MRKGRIILFILAAIFFLIAGTIGYLCFYPRSYDVRHLKSRKNTRYWHLADGSVIGYILVHAKGNPKPYPLIYLHGGPGAGVTDLEIQTLGKLSEDGYDVYLYDQIGCGHSGRLADVRGYTPQQHEKDLEQIIDIIGARKVILIAQSWGSILGVMYLADHPQKVEKLAITAPAPIQPSRSEIGNLPAPDSLHLKEPFFSNREANEKTMNPRVKTIMYFAREFGKKIATDKEADEYATFLTDELHKSEVCDTSKAVRAEGTEGFYAHYMTRISLGTIKDPREIMRKMSLPVLIMKAQCDNQKWGYTNEYLDLFPNHRLVVIPGAGHNIFVERPELYVQTLKAFLTQ